MLIKKESKFLNIELLIIIFILLNISIGGDLYWHTSYSNSIRDIIISNRSLYFNGIFIPNYLLLGFFVNLITLFGILPTIFGPIILLSYSSNTLNFLRKEKKHQIYIILIPIYFHLTYYFSATNLFVITMLSLIIRRKYKIFDKSFLPIVITWCSPIGLIMAPIFFVFDKKNRNNLLYFSIFSISLLFIFQFLIGTNNIFNETIRYSDIAKLLEFSGGIKQEILIGRLINISILLAVFFFSNIIFNKYLICNISFRQIYYFLIILPFIFLLIPIVLSIQKSPNLVNSFFIEKPQFVKRVFKCTWLPRILDEEKCSNASFDRVRSFSFYRYK